jgi:hypothetical protein
MRSNLFWTNKDAEFSTQQYIAVDNAQVRIAVDAQVRTAVDDAQVAYV